MKPDSFKFDWYSANINELPKPVLDCVSSLGDRIVENRGLAFQYHRKNGYQVLDNNDNTVATVLFNDWSDCETIAFSSSDAAMPFSFLVRETWPDNHTVTRLDSCADFFGSASYKKLERVGYKIAKKHDLKYDPRGDPLHPDSGRTQYIGGKSSNFRTRLYEKGLHLIATSPQIQLMIKAGIHPSELQSLSFDGVRIDNLSDWVRLELQARPDGAYARKVAATVTPEQAWFMTSWTSELANNALSLDLDRLYVRFKKQPNDEKALHFMCTQYAAVLERQAASLGSWDCLGRTIQEIIHDYRRLQKMSRH